MLKDIVRVRPLEGHRLEVEFEDGLAGVVDLAEHVEFTGVFAPLAHRDEFVHVTVNPELGTICWPCGADLDPDVLYARITSGDDEIARLPAATERSADRE